MLILKKHPKKEPEKKNQGDSSRDTETDGKSHQKMPLAVQKNHPLGA
jgi:hypothetical protein